MENRFLTIVKRELTLSGALYLYRQGDDSWCAYEASAWMLAQLVPEGLIVGEMELKQYHSVLSTALLSSPLRIPGLTRFRDIAVDDDTFVIRDCGILFDPESYLCWRDQLCRTNKNKYSLK